nr:hypothetical protein [Tanacetum cinerariifolium]
MSAPTANFWQWQHLSSSSSLLLQAVGSSFWQWEFSNQQWQCLVHFIPNTKKVRKFKKPDSPSKKKTLVVVEESTEELAKKPVARRQSTCVSIIDIPGVSMSKKKAPTKAERSKGIELLSKAALLEEAQLKRLSNKVKEKKTFINDDERIESDDDKSVNLNKTGDKEEDEFVHTPDDYLKDAEPADEEKGDEEMAHAKKVNVEHEEVSQEVLEDMDKGVVDMLNKRKPDNADIHESPPIGPDQGLKKKKTGKDTKQSNKVKLIGTSKGTTKSQPRSTSKSVQVEETVFEANPKDWFKKLERPPTPDHEWNKCKLVDRSAYQLLKGTCKSYIELEYNMEEGYKALNDQLYWNNPKGDRYPFDLSKTLPLVQSRNHQIVPVDYFFNNDLAYLEGGRIGRTYTTSLTKTKAAKHDMQGIKDMVPNLWSPVKVAYNMHVLVGTSHWGPKRQTLYGYASNRVSKHNVYSTKRILIVKNVKVNVWYSYGHLEEIKVQRSDQI